MGIKEIPDCTGLSVRHGRKLNGYLHTHTPAFNSRWLGKKHPNSSQWYAHYYPPVPIRKLIDNRLVGQLRASVMTIKLTGSESNISYLSR